MNIPEFLKVQVPHEDQKTLLQGIIVVFVSIASYDLFKNNWDFYKKIITLPLPLTIITIPIFVITLIISLLVVFYFALQIYSFTYGIVQPKKKK